MIGTFGLTHNAKAILLLCGRFSKKESNGDLKPLSLGEYNHLTDWLLNRDMRPADLLTEKVGTLMDNPPMDIAVKRLEALLSRGAAMALAVEKWTNNGIWVICRSDELYPERLKHHLKKNAPAILYGVGNIDLFLRGGLAVVGSRHIGIQAETFTRKVAEESAREGIQIISGGARGVDQIAMLSALDAGGSVVGVLADSLIKASVAGKYRAGIREKRLVLVSPFFPDARFFVGNAMARNKYIYALADVALIVNAEREKGGTWAGATEELRREVARPVFVRSGEDVPEGNRALIKLGAQPFPKPPWIENLTMLLKDAEKALRKPSHKQISLFGEAYSEKLIVAEAKENLETSPLGLSANDNSELPKEMTSAKIAANVYEGALPFLLGAMEDWRSPLDLSKELEVRKPQLDDWLKRAVDQGIVEKKGRPVRYRRVRYNP